ncbi:MAG: translation initiation factor [Flavobacteriales bacterium]|nr:translation initiation factor [Flavobacteriales bacterium]OUW95012.1 MAG: translation initiation factor [Flavobacteriales bacterium TMED228]
MKKKNKKLTVYSTNPNFEYDEDNHEDITLEPSDQLLEVWIDKHRAGKTAIIIKGYVGNLSDIKTLSKKLKTKCGVGGSVKNGEIIIQGNVRDKIMDILKQDGYRYKRVGG